MNTNYKSIFTQFKTFNKVSEDCLYLNVFVPIDATNKSASKAVMVYIHGGSFEIGGNNAPLLNPTLMVNQSDTIIVTIQYRLGVLREMINST